MQEKENRIEFLKQANVAILATIGLGNRPHATPVWYLYEDGDLLVSVGRGSQKHRNVERNRNVTLAVDKRTLPYYAVTVQGTAEIDPPLSQEKRLELAVRYLGEERGRAYAASTADSDSVTLRIRPVKLMEYNGRAGREE